MKRSIIVSVLFILSVFAGYAGDDKGDKATTTLNGTIVNYSDNEPLVGVKVEIVESGKTIYTDLDGNFSISNLPLGEYSLQIQHPSYSEKTIRGLAVNNSTGLTIRLFPN